MKTRVRLAVVNLWVCLLLCSGGQLGAQVQHSRPAGDLVCGPRCVQYLLRHYGQEEELTELVQEIQWPDLEAGASLAAIDEVLQGRGVFTRAVRLPAAGRLKWKHPAIIHLAQSQPAEMGHYVVWLPSSTPHRADVWAGLAGVQSGPVDNLDVFLNHNLPTGVIRDAESERF